MDPELSRVVMARKIGQMSEKGKSDLELPVRSLASYVGASYNVQIHVHVTENSFITTLGISRNRYFSIPTTP